MELTQAQFADRMAVTPLTVHRWETGQSRPRALALERLQALEEAASNRGAADRSEAVPSLPASPVPLDFAGDPAAVLLVAEAYRLAHGHQFNAAFASETARIDPLPHQRIAVYERMLPQEPLRFLLADDAGAGKTIMTGLCVRENVVFGAGFAGFLIVPPAGARGQLGAGASHPVPTAMPHRLRSGLPRWRKPLRRSGWRSGHRIPGHLGDRAGVSGHSAIPASRPYDLVVFDEAHKLSASRTEHRVHQDAQVRACRGAGRSHGRIMSVRTPAFRPMSGSPG